MSSAVRLAIQYVLLFGATGVSLPFASLWFAARGLDGAEIAVILAVPMLARVVTGPVVALWADGFRHRRTAIAVLGLVGGIGYGLVGIADGFAMWALGWFIGATAASTLLPLVDTLSLKAASREGFGFATPRASGSLAFILANVVMGALLVHTPDDIIILWIVVVTLLVGLFAAFGLPTFDEPGRAPVRDRFDGLGRLVGNPAFLTVIMAIGAVQASHAFQYGFSTLIWAQQGISERTIGLLWGFGVVAEIGFMLLFEPWRRRRGIGPGAMLMVGAGAGVIRWTVMAFAPPEWMLWPLQALHALTFAATFLGGVQAVERLTPPEHHTTGQMLSSVLSAGLLIGLATVASGPLYDAFGAMGQLAMAVMAGAGGMAAWRMRVHLK